MKHFLLLPDFFLDEESLRLVVNWSVASVSSPDWLWNCRCMHFARKRFIDDRLCRPCQKLYLFIKVLPFTLPCIALLVNVSGVGALLCYQESGIFCFLFLIWKTNTWRVYNRYRHTHRSIATPPTPHTPGRTYTFVLVQMAIFFKPFVSFPIFSCETKILKKTFAILWIDEFLSLKLLQNCKQHVGLQCLTG